MAAKNKQLPDGDLLIKNFILQGCTNAKQAAIDAGYSPRSAEQSASRVLRSVKAKEAIRAHKESTDNQFSLDMVAEIESLKREVMKLKAVLGESVSGRSPSENNRYAVMHAAGFKCQCCGSKPSKGNDVVLHIDHVIPFSKGGSNEAGNLQVLCSHCNIAKSNYFDFDHKDGWNE